MNWLKVGYLQLVALLICLSMQGCNANSSTNFRNTQTDLDQANQLYFQMKPEQAYDLFDQIWNDSLASDNQKAEAGRNLARMSWLLYDDPNKAFDILEKLNEVDSEKDQAYNLWARILISLKQFDNAISKSSLAISMAKSESDVYKARMAFIEAVIEKQKDLIVNDPHALKFDSTEGNLERAYNMGSGMIRLNPGDIRLSRLYVAISLISEKFESAYEGWLSFYRTESGENITQILKRAEQLFSSGISMYEKGQVKDGIQSIIFALGESGFIDLANTMAIRYGNQFKFDEDAIQDLVLYQNFIVRVQELTLSYYRSIVKGGGNKGKYESDFYDEGEKLFQQFSWKSDRPNYSQSLFKKELRRRFNTIFSLKRANGFYGLHMGHVVLDEKRSVSQYQKSADLRYIAIDHMIANGYSSWFWDGRAQVGGWASEDYFLQVRAAYNKGPINAWLMVTDSIEIDKTLAQIKEMKAIDDSIAFKSPHTYLRGLDLRISFASRMTLLDSLRSTGLTGPDLRMGFISIYEKRIRQSSIFAHEGRHVIDNIYTGFLSSSEDEFRAKLSEVYFAYDPFLAFEAVLSRNIGDKTAHGKANLKVVRKVVEWMEEHKREIAGFDQERPTLPQLDLLTDDQLRLAIRSIDPLAR